ncbi:hypothetical protein ACW6QP_07915 [Salegentibacter sp. HM20]
MQLQKKYRDKGEQILELQQQRKFNNSLTGYAIVVILILTFIAIAAVYLDWY